MTKPTEFKDQKQSLPGQQSKMIPKPEVIRKGYKGSDKLKGKVALITGGDSGIGRSVAVYFAREGADVAIVYISEDKDAKETKKMVEKEGQKCLLLQGDIKSETFCKKAVESCVKKLGGLNILVNNAAIQFPQDSLQLITSNQLKETFETNIYSFFYLSKLAIDHFSPGDTIINTSSKGAIVGFTRSLALMVAKDKIRVNGVAPGPIWTPLIPATFDDVKKFGQDTALGRAGQPSEVAPAYVFLASEDSSYITGQFIHVNGGEIVGG